MDTGGPAGVDPNYHFEAAIFCPFLRDCAVTTARQTQKQLLLAPPFAKNKG
jgi:hypothetical protein